MSNFNDADIYKLYCTSVLILIKLHVFQKSLDKPLGTVSMCDDNIFELVRTRTYSKFNHWAVNSFRLLKHYSKLSWFSFTINFYHKHVSVLSVPATRWVMEAKEQKCSDVLLINFINKTTVWIMKWDIRLSSIPLAFAWHCYLEQKQYVYIV